MPDNLRLIEGGYLRDILAQPRALEDTIAGLEISPALQDAADRLAHGRFERIVLTGMGGSFWALHPISLQFLNRGRTAIMAETSELIHFTPGILDRRTLLIAASQSGRSAEIVRLLDIKQPDCFVLGITNTPDSPLAQRADAAVLTHAGEEFTVSCKTYVATLAALQWTASVLMGSGACDPKDELRAAPQAVEAYLSHWRDHVREAARALAGARDLFLLGRGASLAAAGTGALITKESAHFHAEGMSSASFRHGPLEMVGAGLYALVFAGDPAAAPLNSRLVDDIRQAGGEAALAGEDAEPEIFRLPRVPSAVRPILEILPVEMITLALAAASGREAGKFDRATKVTTTE
jgi:glucosamine--fructose-6-phosphate aminotransferase (isomerizing)